MSCAQALRVSIELWLENLDFGVTTTAPGHELQELLEMVDYMTLTKV